MTKKKLIQSFEKALIKSINIKKNTKINNSQLKVRNKIYLLIKNLKTRRLTKKFDHVKVELFFINKIYHTKDGH